MPFQRFLLLATPLIFAVIWSTGWIAAKYAAPHADPLWYLTIRFSCAAAVITIFAVAVGAPWPKGTRNWLHALISGVLLHGIYLGGVWWAVKHGLSAGLSGLLAALQPLVTAWLGPYLLNEDISRRQWAGVAFGLLGVVLVLSPKLGFAGGLATETAWVPLAINVVGVMSLTAGSFYQKRFVSAGDLRTVTSVQYLGALLVVLPLALLTEDLFFDHSFEVYAVLVWSVLVLSVFAIALMLWMINRGEVMRVSALGYLVPSIVAIQAWLMFGEQLNTVQIGGMVLTAIGVHLATSRK